MSNVVALKGLRTRPFVFLDELEFVVTPKGNIAIAKVDRMTGKITVLKRVPQKITELSGVAADAQEIPENLYQYIEQKWNAMCSIAQRKYPRAPRACRSADCWQPSLRQAVAALYAKRLSRSKRIGQTSEGQQRAPWQEEFHEGCRHILQSSFLRGSSEAGYGHQNWRLTLRWALRPGNWDKIVEGLYDD